MISYQCSPLSTAEGIVNTFNQCAKLQEENDLRKYTSVVILDEVGLAEDSPQMPLKVCVEPQCKIYVAHLCRSSG